MNRRTKFIALLCTLLLAWNPALLAQGKKKDRGKKAAPKDWVTATMEQMTLDEKRSLDLIRSEVADLTLEATARVTGKVLDAEDQRRLIDEAIAELDFSALDRESS